MACGCMRVLAAVVTIGAVWQCPDVARAAFVPAIGYDVVPLDVAVAGAVGFSPAVINDAGQVGYGTSKYSPIGYYRGTVDGLRAGQAPTLVAAVVPTQDVQMNGGGTLAWQTFTSGSGLRQLFVGTPATGSQLYFAANGFFQGNLLGGASSLPALNDAGLMAFHSGTFPDRRTFVATKASPTAPLTIIADSNDTTQPYGGFNSDRSPAINNAGSVAYFGAFRGGGNAVWHRTLAGVVTLLAGPTPQRPDGFTVAGNPAMNDREEVVFSTGSELVYVTPGGTPRVLFTAGQFGALSISPPDINDEGQIAFQVNSTSPTGGMLYTLDSYLDTTPLEVIRRGQLLLGGEPTFTVNLIRGGLNNGNQLVFTAFTRNNSTGQLISTGVFLANPVIPEPAAVGTLAAASVLSLRRRRRAG